MNIIEKKVSELIPYENNPRLNDGAVEAVAESIEEFGFKVPIVVDKNDVIVAGHTRLKAAKMLGLQVVPVVVADDLSAAKIKAFRLADNKTGELADWDFNVLGGELGELSDVDMSKFGFEEMIEGDSFGTKFSLPDNDEPLTKTMTFTFSAAQYDVVSDALGEIELTEFDEVDNQNKNGNKLYKLVVQWDEAQRR